jgi:hypothetical protein
MPGGGLVVSKYESGEFRGCVKQRGEERSATYVVVLEGDNGAGYAVILFCSIALYVKVK